jgi:hypothetical protein
MAIQMVKVRAIIEIGDGNLTAGTPPLPYDNHILSFNVDKARGQISSFSASLKVLRTEISGGLLDSASVVIRAGTLSTYQSNKIFTGIIRNATITPNREDPEYVILNISGNDVLSRLNGKKFTRRCRGSKGVWVSIDGVAREGLRDQKLAFEQAKPSLDYWGGELYREEKLTTTRAPVTDENVESVKDDYVKKEVVINVSPAEVQ